MRAGRYLLKPPALKRAVYCSIDKRAEAAKYSRKPAVFFPASERNKTEENGKLRREKTHFSVFLRFFRSLAGKIRERRFALSGLVLYTVE